MSDPSEAKRASKSQMCTIVCPLGSKVEVLWMTNLSFRANVPFWLFFFDLFYPMILLFPRLRLLTSTWVFYLFGLKVPTSRSCERLVGTFKHPKCVRFCTLLHAVHLALRDIPRKARCTAPKLSTLYVRISLFVHVHCFGPGFAAFERGRAGPKTQTHVPIA